MEHSPGDCSFDSSHVHHRYRHRTPMHRPYRRLSFARNSHCILGAGQHPGCIWLYQTLLLPDHHKNLYAIVHGCKLYYRAVSPSPFPPPAVVPHFHFHRVSVRTEKISIKCIEFDSENRAYTTGVQNFRFRRANICVGFTLRNRPYNGVM